MHIDHCCMLFQGRDEAGRQAAWLHPYDFWDLVANQLDSLLHSTGVGRSLCFLFHVSNLSFLNPFRLNADSAIFINPIGLWPTEMNSI